MLFIWGIWMLIPPKLTVTFSKEMLRLPLWYSASSWLMAL